MEHITHFGICPRCGTESFESLNGYSHCIECLYYEDRYYHQDTALISAISALNEFNHTIYKNKISDINQKDSFVEHCYKIQNKKNSIFPGQEGKSTENNTGNLPDEEAS